MSQSELKIIECPRDAMQGIKEFIPTEVKIDYLNQLLKVGFHTLDFGSFVSPKAIPQLKDTAEVLAGLDLEQSNTKLLAIIANERGAKDAVQHEEIAYLGYPFSISETFQQRNTNASIEESLDRVARIQNLTLKNNKDLVIYISMGFGNPYGDPYHEDIVADWLRKLKAMDIRIFALSDTIGVSEPGIINRLFSTLIPEYPDLEIGAHLHTTPDSWKEKVEAAYDSGCRRFDGAIAGYGGCPMAADDLTGNMPTEKMIGYFNEVLQKEVVDMDALDQAIQEAGRVF
ncbi:MAG: hydroxymethylglutaryl-CoA lyase [Flavobacteriales bacterium]|nr:hydroxymethylglutaryl-CoA lyase [Flavobacteriales bacterium]|tara:strand:- start:7795 stop:8652 length:858 start_codon:yes stop_codon:yes gene_type:complete